MDSLSLLSILISLLLFIAIILYITRNKSNARNELSSHGFLGKKILIPVLILFLLFTSFGITQVINNSNLDNRSLADTSKHLTITYDKSTDGYDLTGKFENSTTKLVKFVWEIENFNQNTYTLSELKEIISKVKISNPLTPIKITLTILDSENNILAKKTLTIE